MIKNFGDHSANERTFLAWLRTGISIIAFGVVIEKFNTVMAAWRPPRRRAWPGSETYHCRRAVMTGSS